jgi:hypothetical protein
MPYHENHSYRPPAFLFNRHLETIYPALFRKINPPYLVRERLELADGDFLDLDWSKSGSRKLVIINHGLEGNSTRPYMLGMMKLFNAKGWDTLGWNFRGCSGEMNRLARFYHSGETEDMHAVLCHAEKEFDEIVLVGFSLGGNMILKYLGENPHRLSQKIRAAAVFSVPVHLKSSCRKIMKRSNLVYERRFLNNLKQKVLKKSSKYPQAFDLDTIMQAKSIMEFDNLVTAPLHGYKNALDYYTQNSALQFLKEIRIPTLLVNALNDPMLSSKCFPVNEAKENPDLIFEKWKYGGHVGFYDKGEFYKSDQKALAFVQEILANA